MLKLLKWYVVCLLGGGLVAVLVAKVPSLGIPLLALAMLGVLLGGLYLCMRGVVRAVRRS